MAPGISTKSLSRHLAPPLLRINSHGIDFSVKIFMRTQQLMHARAYRIFFLGILGDFSYKSSPDANVLKVFLLFSSVKWKYFRKRTVGFIVLSALCFKSLPLLEKLQYHVGGTHRGQHPCRLILVG